MSNDDVPTEFASTRLELAIAEMRDTLREAIEWCDAAELLQLVKLMRAFSKRRAIHRERGIVTEPEVRADSFRIDRARRHEVLRGLRELRDSKTWSQSKPTITFTVINGGEE